MYICVCNAIREKDLRAAARACAGNWNFRLWGRFSRDFRLRFTFSGRESGLRLRWWRGLRAKDVWSSGDFALRLFGDALFQACDPASTSLFFGDGSWLFAAGFDRCCCSLRRCWRANLGSSFRWFAA